MEGRSALRARSIDSAIGASGLQTFSCDNLVIGAGPAGTSCAHWLARQGQDVLLVDQCAFPRHKVCGDGLIPDALAALARLGLLDEVLAKAHLVDHVRCVAPSSRAVEISAPMAVISRYCLDEILLKAALAQGASFKSNMHFERLSRESEPAGQVNGAWFRKLGEAVFVGARRVVLATGASAAALGAAGVSHRRAPSAMALRTIIRHPDLRGQISGLQVIWHRALSPGYAWIFPMSEHCYNMGIGVFDVAEAWPQHKLNLRSLYERFVAVNPLAGRLHNEGETILALKGAPLRSGLVGAKPWQEGLIICGEAIGSTYGLTGEGIGKAMETGIMAAESMLSSDAAQGLANAQTGPMYESSLQGLRARYAQYEKANRINRQPWLAELLIQWAARSERLRDWAFDVLNEKRSPEDLVTVSGLMRLLLQKS